MRDIAEGVNALRAIGHDRVIVVGICSAAWSMLVAGPLPGLHALVPINPQLFVRESGQVPEFVPGPTVSPRRGGASAKLSWLLPIAKARFSHYSRRAIRQLTRAGVEVHVVFADGDVGHRFWRYALAPIATTRAGLAVHVVPDLGHNLENVVVRGQVMDLIATLADVPGG